MNWLMEIHNLNYLAVAAATVASYVLGFTWYHWSFFGEAWANALGITKEQADDTEGLGGAFFVSLLSVFAKTLCVAVLMSALNLSGFFSGLGFGAMMSAVFIVASLGYYNGFARVSPRLTLINAAHSLTELALIGAMIGAFS